jgi:hypothetical protein
LESTWNKFSIAAEGMTPAFVIALASLQRQCGPVRYTVSHSQGIDDAVTDEAAQQKRTKTPTTFFATV